MLPYASGLDRPVESAIAAAIIERLRLLHRDAGLFLACVEESPVMPSRMSDRESWDGLLRTMNGRAPAALVIIDSARTSPGAMSVSRSEWLCTYDVTIAVFSNHARDLVLGRLDPDAASRAHAGKDPGIRAACELIDALLLGFALDIECVGAIEPGRQGMQTVYAGALGTLREMNYTVEAKISRTEWPDIPGYLESVHTALTALETPALDMETELST